MRLRIAEADYEKEMAKQAMLDTTHTKFNNNLITAGLKATPPHMLLQATPPNKYQQDVILQHPVERQVEQKRSKLKAILEKTVGSDFYNEETDIQLTQDFNGLEQPKSLKFGNERVATKLFGYDEVRRVLDKNIRKL